VEPASAQELLDHACAEFSVPGAQLGLVRGDERLLVSSGVIAVGTDRPVTAGTAFHAGSLAKSLAGLTVLRAARDDHLGLDAPCSEQGEGLWEETPRVLLTQTSGRANLLPDPEDELEDFVARAGAAPLVHAPGRFSYCNAGWSVLDLLLLRATGRSFEESAQELLGRRLTFEMPDDAAAGHAIGAGRPPMGVPATFAPAASAAGSQWWVTGDQLLDYALLHLGGGQGRVDVQDIADVQQPAAALPGATVFDAWGMGFAAWQRGDHRAFGWAGYTGGHRAFLRGFPDQGAAVVVLANCAGPLFGPPGGSALFDALLPRLLDDLAVPPLPAPAYDATPEPTARLSGRFGPLVAEPAGPDGITLHAEAFGVSDPVTCERLGGNTFSVRGNPPGSTPFAFDDDLLYLGPFALPRG